MISGLIDLSRRAMFRLTGGDRERYLNGQVTNDVRRATAGAAIEACVCNVKGRLEGVVQIARSAEGDAFLIDAPGELRESLLARLSRYVVADDCEWEDATGAIALVHALGDRPDLPGARWLISDRFGVPGHDLWVQPASLAAVLGLGGRISDEAAEDLRIRRGVPKWGAELGPETLPAEVGLDRRAIDFHKGCYVGQEVVSRIESVGRVHRALILLRSLGGTAAVGAPVFAGPGAEGEKPVGAVTSVSPDGRHALALVKCEYSAPETKLVLLNNCGNMASQIWEVRTFESG